jgi:hypothetical protein
MNCADGRAIVCPASRRCRCPHQVETVLTFVLGTAEVCAMVAVSTATDVPIVGFVGGRRGTYVDGPHILPLARGLVVGTLCPSRSIWF